MTKRKSIYIAFLILVSKFCFSQAYDTRPNIVFILADDLGWSELGCYGNKFNETPNIDSLANKGILFKQAYAAAPVCSPYRAALLTGQYPIKTGITDYLRPNDNPLSVKLPSIAKVLKNNGYYTGMIGKWHLTGYAYEGSENEIRATDHGFYEEILSEIKGVGNGANFYPYVFRNQPISWLKVSEKKMEGEEYLTDRINYEAVSFIEKNKSKSFFLFISHYAPHTILNGKKDLVEKYRKKHPPGESSRQICYLCQDQGFDGDPLNHWASSYNPHLAAMIESIDDGVGMIVNKLESLDLLENTIIVFTSDNGGEAPNVTSNHPLRGGKSQLYEGGIRVPLIISWPNIIKANSKSNAVTSNIDFYPTIVDALGIQHNSKDNVDGISIKNVLENPNYELNRESIFWHYPLEKPHFLGGTSSGAIRSGDWKLIEFFDDQRLELYNLKYDRSESLDVADFHPIKTKELFELLQKWRANLNFINSN